MLFVCLIVCLFVCSLVCSISLIVCLFICLFVCVFVCCCGHWRHRHGAVVTVVIIEAVIVIDVIVVVDIVNARVLLASQFRGSFLKLRNKKLVQV